ncbi:alpha/beta hydrolase [Phanerochaete sordida]|uniref:Alpha/beta hydrolase n=1 Tax=Phanerochaete sordida TaxID=48140 RepID=A0A9P3LE52_9APHY|nr:alpha/beta hydrolase [Phanerochaete sordida]
MRELVVDDEGTKLAYIDSDVPSTAEQGYITIFAIHGAAFTSHVFDRVMDIAPQHGVRFVAINRRDYPGSSPLSRSDLEALSSESADAKAAFLRARGVEFATFICRFAAQHNIPAASPVGKSGGFAVLGWSLGCAFAHATVSHFDTLPAGPKEYFSQNLRGLILFEPPTVAIGAPHPPGAWSPHIDTTLTPPQRAGLFTHWVSAYFAHGALHTRDPAVLEHVVPAPSRPPSVYGMSAAERARAAYPAPAQASDMRFMRGAAGAIRASYRRACFDAGVRAALPKMRVALVVGDATTALCLSAYFAVQDDDDEAGGGRVVFKLLRDTNHFVQWDEPELALQTFLACLD